MIASVLPMYRGMGGDWRYAGLRGLGDVVQDISAAIAQYEGYNTAGTLAQRNNNPGNLRSGPGQVGSSGGFAVFPDVATGWAALNHQVNLNISRGLNLNQFFAGEPGVYPGYAPASDANKPLQYAAFVAGQTGIDPTVPLSSITAGSDGSDTAVEPGDPTYGLPAVWSQPEGQGFASGSAGPLLLAAAALTAFAVLSA